MYTVYQKSSTKVLCLDWSYCFMGNSKVVVGIVILSDTMQHMVRTGMSGRKKIT